MSAVNLLDVNILLALFWPPHSAHAVALRWFERHAGEGWATCALTQSGFVRLMANPGVTLGDVSAGDALEMLRVNCKAPGHVLWPMNIGLAEAVELSGVKVEGYRQVTDSYLIGLAVKHKGRLVTFDKALGKLSKHVTVI